MSLSRLYTSAKTNSPLLSNQAESTQNSSTIIQAHQIRRSRPRGRTEQRRRNPNLWRCLSVDGLDSFYILINIMFLKSDWTDDANVKF